MDYFDIARATAARVKKYRAAMPEEELVCRVSRSEPGSVPPFKRTILGKALMPIGNIRRASPESGTAVRPKSFSVRKYAVAYQNCPVGAVCACTEPFYYRGEDEFVPLLKKLISLPVLMDDFIITPYQIYYAKLLGADAIMLISTIMATKKLAEFISLAGSIGLSVVAVAHSVKSAVSAVNAGADMICADNLSPKTYKYDYDTALRIRERVPENIGFLVKNAREDAEYIKMLKKAGTNAVIMGDAFMRGRSKTKRLSELAFTVN